MCSGGKTNRKQIQKNTHIGAKGRNRAFWYGETGSMTVEAVILFPLLFLLFATCLCWGLALKDDLHAMDERGEKYRTLIRSDTAIYTNGEHDVPFDYNVYEEQADNTSGDSWFLYGGKPARRIRDADSILDLGRTLIGMLPKWFQAGKDTDGT